MSEMKQELKGQEDKSNIYIYILFCSCLFEKKDKRETRGEV